MVIVFVVDNYANPMNGSIMTAIRFKKELERQGHTVRVISNTDAGDNIFPLKTRRIPIATRVAGYSGMSYAKFNKRIVKSAIQGADIVHLFFPFQLQRKTLKLAGKMNIPVTAAFHLHPDNVLRNCGFKMPRFVTRLVFRRFRRGLYDKVKHVHCPSDFIAEELRANGYRSQMHVISNGITKNFKPVPRSRPEVTQENPFKILMIGRFNNEKRHDLLISALSLSRYADVIDITFAGSGPLQQELQTRAAALPRPPTFGFFPQDKLLKLIHESDLYIHAADVEIEGISCIEAFATGLVPLIGNSPNSATKQFALYDRSLFECGNATSLREKIEYWVENPAHLMEASSDYIKHAKNFTIEQSVTKIIQMFKIAIQDQKTPMPHDHS